MNKISFQRHPVTNRISLLSKEREGYIKGYSILASKSSKAKWFKDRKKLTAFMASMHQTQCVPQLEKT